MVNMNILKRKMSLEQKLRKKPRIEVQEDADDNCWTEVEQPYMVTSDQTDDLWTMAQEILNMVDMRSPNQTMISEHKQREENIVEVEDDDADATLSVVRPATPGMIDAYFDQVVTDCATTAEQNPLLFTSDGLVRLFVDINSATPAREHFTVTTDRNYIPVICIQLYEKLAQKIKRVKSKCRPRKRNSRSAPPTDVKLLEIIFDGIQIAPLAVPRVTVTVQMLTPDYIEVLVQDWHTSNERFAAIELSVI